jgi:hypothetical protein
MAHNDNPARQRVTSTAKLHEAYGRAVYTTGIDRSIIFSSRKDKNESLATETNLERSILLLYKREYMYITGWRLDLEQIT